MSSSVPVYFPDATWTAVLVDAFTTAADLCRMVVQKRQLHLEDTDWFALYLVHTTETGSPSKPQVLGSAVPDDDDSSERCLDGSEVLVEVAELVDAYLQTRPRDSSVHWRTATHIVTRLNPLPLRDQLEHAGLRLVFKTSVKQHESGVVAVMSAAEKRRKRRTAGPGDLPSVRELHEAGATKQRHGSASGVGARSPSHHEAVGPDSKFYDTLERPQHSNSHSGVGLSRTLTAFQMSDRGRAGWMEKRGKRNTSWKPRWFMLSGHQVRGL